MLASCAARFNGWSVCTAYEIGKKGSGLPTSVNVAGMGKLSSSEIRLVRPTLMAPVFRRDGDVREMSWGFRRQFRGAKGPILRTIVNTREAKLDSPMWAEAFRLRRCVIPAIAFYEWVEGAGGRSVPLRFTRQDDNGLLVAGIWEVGEHGESFSMVTTEPSDFVRKVHDRMPAVLADEQVEPYLDGSLYTFGPTRVPMGYAPAPNFLRPEVPPEKGHQGFLF